MKLHFHGHGSKKPTEYVQSLIDMVDRVSTLIGKAVSLLIPVVVILIAIDVILRYAFHMPTIWAGETATLIFGVSWTMAGAFALSKGKMVRMEVFFARLSRKNQAIVNLITAPVFLVFAVTILWQGSKFFLISAKYLEHSPSLWAPPVYPIKLFIPIGAFLLLIQGLANYLRDILAILDERGRSLADLRLLFFSSR